MASYFQSSSPLSVSLTEPQPGDMWPVAVLLHPRHLNFRRASGICIDVCLKVHKREKFFSSDFEFFTILYLVKLKY
jgi:hypothetical protein